MNTDKLTAEPTLPYANWWPLVAGALCGVILRLIFSGNKNLSAMAPAFFGFAPLAVGAVTVYVAERSARRSWGYYVTAGIMANVLFILATLLILIEGLICAILIIPLFSVYGALGALLMGAICRLTNWPKPPVVLSFSLLPLLLALVLPHGAVAPYMGASERSIIVDADAATIWRQLHDTRDIAPAEVGQAWMYRIGVPTPQSGVTRLTSAGLEREVRMGKGIHFSQHASAWESGRYVRWTYRFSADSFPPGALDDHVKIGGEYFDLIDTEYLITPLSAHSSSLTARMHYRVSTQFNWYAKHLANGLIGNFEEVILRFYGARAAAAQQRTSGQGDTCLSQQAAAGAAAAAAAAAANIHPTRTSLICTIGV